MLLLQFRDFESVLMDYVFIIMDDDLLRRDNPEQPILGVNVVIFGMVPLVFVFFLGMVLVAASLSLPVHRCYL